MNMNLDSNLPNYSVPTHVNSPEDEAYEALEEMAVDDENQDSTKKNEDRVEYNKKVQQNLRDEIEDEFKKRRRGHKGKMIIPS